MAVAHSQGEQQRRWDQWVETHPRIISLMGSGFPGDLLCRSSLEWNNHTAQLASRISSRKAGFTAMWDLFRGSLITDRPRAPVLVLGIGNPSRGDDAIGPALVERLEAMSPQGVEVLTDFQLQVEHVFDLRGRQAVIFADASVSGAEPFLFVPVAPAPDASYSTHALAPAALLHHCRQLIGEIPDSYVLAVRGYKFDFGAAMSSGARRNVEAAIKYVLAFVAQRPADTEGAS